MPNYPGMHLVSQKPSVSRGYRLLTGIIKRNTITDSMGPFGSGGDFILSPYPLFLYHDKTHDLLCDV